MLTKFCVENYKNFKDKIEFTTYLEFALVYGVCGCGKSNFCEALFDIHKAFRQVISTPVNVDNDLSVHFWYEFNIRGEDVCYEYERNYQGEILYMNIQISKLQFTCNLPHGKMLDFLLKEHRKTGITAGCISEILDELVFFITHMKFISDEKSGEIEYNKGVKKQKRMLAYGTPVSFLIIDDADLYYKGDLKNRGIEQCPSILA